MMELTSGWMVWYWGSLVFVLGLCFGSFLNVCICRIPEEESVVHPPSACPKCGTRIGWRDNIPVLSWLMLRARCRQCGQPISAQYPAVELLTGGFFLALWMMYGFSWLTLVYQLAVFGLLLGTFVDLSHMILPDRVTIGGMVLFPVLSLLVPEMHGRESWAGGLQASLTGLAVGFGLFWTIREVGSAVYKKEAMGFGDVKLMGALGALLGWPAVFYITFVSALIGSVVGVGLIALNRKELQSQIPYGPYIAVAAFSWILGGSRLWPLYVALLRG